MPEVNYIIPCMLPGFNEMLGEALKNRRAYGRMKKEYTGLCMMASPNIKMKRVEHISIVWYVPNKRKDKDNIIASQKFIFDGLEKNGTIKRDSFNNIGTIFLDVKLDRNKPRIEVSIKYD